MDGTRRSNRLKEARRNAGAFSAQDKGSDRSKDRRISVGAALGVTPQKSAGSDLAKAKAVDSAMAAAIMLDDINVTKRRKQRSSNKKKRENQTLSESGKAGAARYEPKSLALLQKTTELFDVEEKCESESEDQAGMPSLPALTGEHG